MKPLSRVWLLVTPWTAAYQAPSSMGFSRQEYWSGVPLPSPMYTWITSNYILIFTMLKGPKLSISTFNPCSFIIGASQMVLMVKNCLPMLKMQCGFNPWIKKIPWKRKLHLTPVFLPGKSWGQKTLVGYNPWSLRVRQAWAYTHTHTYTHNYIMR